MNNKKKEIIIAYEDINNSNQQQKIDIKEEQEEEKKQEVEVQQKELKTKNLDKEMKQYLKRKIKKYINNNQVQPEQNIVKKEDYPSFRQHQPYNGLFSYYQ